MSEYEKKVVEDLRQDARKIGVWSEVREDLKNAAELIEHLISEREILMQNAAEAFQEGLNENRELFATEVQKVRHGEWVRQKGRPEAVCSECGREVVYKIADNKWWFEDFCPHCGAKMDGKGDA